MSQSVTITATGGGVTQTAALPLSVTAQPDSQAPTAPGAVTATASAYNQVNLAWTASTDDVGVTGYRVYKDGVVLPQTTTQTTYQVTGLSANTTYRFQIEAYDQSGKATRSLEKSVTTPSAPDTTNPTVSITGLTAGQNVSGTVTLTASALDNVGVTGVQFAVAGQSLGAQDTTSPYSVSWNTTNIANGTTVQITATAYDAAGNSAVATLSVRVNNVVADTTGPQISAISESGITTIGAISSFSTNEPAIYSLRYWVLGNNTLSFVYDIATYRTSHQVTISGLLPNTNYQYDIVAFDQAGNQTQSIARSFKTAALVVSDTTPPPSISSLQVVSKSARAVTVSWVAPLDTGGSQNSGKVASYSLAYAGFSLSDSNWANARFAGGLPSPANAGVTQSYTLVDLSPNTTYSIALKSKDAAGLESSISNIISVTTLAENTTPPSTGGTGGAGAGVVVDSTPPGKINKLKVKEFDSQLSLSWENPTNTDFVRTVVVRKEATAPASRTDGVKVYEGAGTGFNDLNLENNKGYFYALYTVDSSSNYSDAEIISAKPKAGTTQATEVATTGNNPVPGTGSTSSGALPPVTGPFSVGMTSEQVKVLQTVLAQDPTIYPEGKVTGYYGPATVLAVQRFQEKYMGIVSGSPTTNGYGLAGQTTRAKINEVFSLTSSSGSTGTVGNTNPLPPVTTGGTGLVEKVTGPFSVGMTSEQVKVLQRVLAKDSTIYPEGVVTGYYGSGTVSS
jgi:peptidoglycan hydrolase-like protein with peptidoglycan-binding domain/chitodextrinase